MDECEAIVAIDFGTSNISFAFSFSAEEDVIHLATYNSNTEGDDATPVKTDGSTLQEDGVPLASSHISKLPQNRVPPVLLLNANGTINSFGKLAVDRYAQLVVTKRHQGYRYFDRFKMELYRKFQSILALEIQDKEGRKSSTLTLFSQLIRYIGKLALQAMREATSSEGRVTINPKSVFWVLTVPAIWSDSARQFLREAAVEAGIPRAKLRLAREPEAAAIFWKREMQKSAKAIDLQKLSVGNKYIIADLGGGTVDVCTHEILPDDRLRELFKATGNDIGGIHVDNMFVQFLAKLVGDKAWKTFYRQQYFDFVKLMRNFEELKRKFDHETKDIIIELPPSLIKLAEQHSRSSFGDIIKDSEDMQYLNLEGNRVLHLKGEIMDSFFKPSVDGIVNTVKDILQRCNKDKINTLLLSGGYSKSPYVREIIKREFSSMALIQVPEQDLAVLKGAVMMGYEPVDIIERRARYTYGFAIARPFQEKVHPKELKFMRDGKLLCRDIFHKLIYKNQLLRVGDRFTIETRNNDRKYLNFKLREACAQLFSSTAENPSYCTEKEDCTELFTIKIEAPQRGWSERLCIDYILVVGDTDFEVQAIDLFTGKEFQTRKEIL